MKVQTWGVPTMTQVESKRTRHILRSKEPCVLTVDRRSKELIDNTISERPEEAIGQLSVLSEFNIAYTFSRLALLHSGIACG